MAAARSGMVSQLQSFTHNSSEFLRREQDLLLHGTGLPTLRTAMAGRPVVVVSDRTSWTPIRKRLQAVPARAGPRARRGRRRRRRAGRGGLQPARRGGHGRRGAAERQGAAGRPATSSLVVEPGAAGSAAERLERLGVRPHRLETTATAEDAALLLADAGGRRGHRGRRRRARPSRSSSTAAASGLASTYLTRLKVGTRRGRRRRGADAVLRAGASAARAAGPAGCAWSPWRPPSRPRRSARSGRDDAAGLAGRRLDSLQGRSRDPVD